MKSKLPGGSKLGVYSNLTARRKNKADVRARKKAEYLATLPKHPVKRLLYRLHPKRFFKYWFSREGALTLLKLGGVFLVALAIFAGALFAYYRRELDSIRPSEISKRVQTTVTKYYDRNGVLLWEDKGDGNYKLVVDSKDIAPVMKEATVSIEDKDFYKHPGVSPTGLLRAAVNNAQGGSTQGGSTLTQQLVKNVFFSTESGDRGLGGIPRKIKEVILAIEVERMYNKDQILALYLNEVPYGGPRSGVESAAQSYFGKAAKDLTLPEAALLAGIPQNPTYYNPYVIEGNKDLVARQHTVLNSMAAQGYITKKEADEAKKVAILDTIKPEVARYQDMKAPHFILEVQEQLEKEFGQKLARSGGLSVKTTLDWRLQEIAEKAVTDSYNKYINVRGSNGADNMAFTSIDVPTGQVLAMVGSYDFNNPEYGSVNAATELLQPGSSIKVFDYSELFKQRTGQNYGAGSVLADEDISSIYKTKLYNYDGKFFGNIPIREALGNSRNPPAVKAAYIAGIDNVVKLARDMGDHSYCVDEDYGLSAAIGGCRVRQVEHVNAYASLARGGVYKPEAYILDVTNSQGQKLKEWKDESTRVLDPQIPYIISDMLTDPKARSRVFGPSPLGMAINGVKTATKTGTTDNGKDKAKDNWMMSYTPRIAAGVWVGRHDGGALNTISSQAPGAVISDFMSRAHKEIFEKDGSWKPSDWFTKPAGIQTLNIGGRTDIFPSWFVKPQNAEGTKMMFDRVSHKKTTNCTPEKAKIEQLVQVFEDPVTKKKVNSAPDGYDAEGDDDRHKCDDVKPFVSLDAQSLGKGKYRLTANVSQGTFPLQSLDFAVDGQIVSSQSISGPGTYTAEYTFTSAGQKELSAIVIDQGWYDTTGTKSLNASVSSLQQEFAATLDRWRR